MQEKIHLNGLISGATYARKTSFGYPHACLELPVQEKIHLDILMSGATYARKGSFGYPHVWSYLCKKRVI